MSSLVDILANFATAGAAIAAAIVAVLGLRAWRVQLHGKAEYQLARRLLRAVYRVRDKIQAVRAPVMLGGEIAAAIEHAGRDPKEVSEEEKGVLGYELRWQAVTEAWSDLDVERLEAEVLWGEDIVNRLRKLRECTGLLYGALFQHAQTKTGQPWEKRKSEESLRRIDEILFHISDDPEVDPFTGKLHVAVTEIESFIRPKMRL